MRIFRTTYKDLAGKTRKASKWYVEFRDHTSRARRIPAFTDKSESEKFGHKLERLVASRANNELPDLDLSRWIGGMLPYHAAKLAEWGIIDGERVASSRPLADHVTDYRASLEAENRDERYVRGAVAQVERIIEGCTFTYWRDVNAAKVQTFLKSLRDGDNGEQAIGHRTYNDYVTAFKAFINWAVGSGCIASSPLMTLGKLSVTDETARRAFDLEEFRWLLAVTAKADTRFGMTGADRALLYRVAVETGLRASELRSLTRASFDLAGEMAGVTIEASEAKNKRTIRLPLPQAIVADLGGHLSTRMPAAQAFNVPDSTYTAKMMYADLEEARAEWIRQGGDDQSAFLKQFDDAERRLDFHSLRHTRGVWLFQYHRASPREVQELMRLSSVALVDRYTRSFRLIDDKLVERGPDLSSLPNVNSMKATGTDGAPLVSLLGAQAGHNPTNLDNLDTSAHASTMKPALGYGVTVAQQSLNLLV